MKVTGRAAVYNTDDQYAPTTLVAQTSGNDRDMVLFEINGKKYALVILVSSS